MKNLNDFTLKPGKLQASSPGKLLQVNPEKKSGSFVQQFRFSGDLTGIASTNQQTLLLGSYQFSQAGYITRVCASAMGITGVTDMRPLHIWVKIEQNGTLNNNWDNPQQAVPGAQGGPEPLNIEFMVSADNNPGMMPVDRFKVSPADVFLLRMIVDGSLTAGDNIRGELYITFEGA
jgi:hypothetical protein